MERFGSNVSAAPAPVVQLIAKCDGCGRPPGTEELPRKFFHDRRVITLAAENIEIGIVGVIGKVAADQGRRDQLDHRIACDPPRAKIHDLTFPESLHVDELTEFDDIAADMIGIAD